jgi:hypothetical protein
MYPEYRAENITGREVETGILFHKKPVNICDSEIIAISKSGNAMAVSLVAQP